MNFKRKLWWAQHRIDVYKYSMIVLLTLIVPISIIYFTYSKFSSSNEMTMYETTVEPFIKNDYFIASYIDGEWSNEIPGKNDGYAVDKIVCDNGAVGTWDNDKWAITIENATKKIKCGVYFKQIYKDNVIAEAPELAQGMIPVKFDSSGNVVVADTATKWYDYSNHEWANAVLVNCADSAIKSKYFDSNNKVLASAVGKTISMDEIMQMYVYIPRYKYQLFNAEDGTSVEQAINITFESKTTAKSTGTKNGEWLTHPAFTFGDKELAGIWVGKFETSNTSVLPKIVPNISSLRSMNVSSQFNTSRLMTTTLASTYGTSTNDDSHMMKNMEWGAVAYLSSSIYGRYTNASTCIESGCEVWINNNSSHTTGCAGSSVSASPASTCNAWNTATGVNASTTGNIYGIYDMSGGAYEYVMGNYNDKIDSAGFSSMPEDKYYDKYTGTDSKSDFTKYHLGDATKETLKTKSTGGYSWYGDYSYSVDFYYPWVLRGGVYFNDTTAGLFYFGIVGTYLDDYSFRVVLNVL